MNCANSEIYEILYSDNRFEKLISIKLVDEPDLLDNLILFGIERDGFVCCIRWYNYINIKFDVENKLTMHRILYDEVIKFKRLEKLKELYE